MVGTEEPSTSFSSMSASSSTVSESIPMNNPLIFCKDDPRILIHNFIFSFLNDCHICGIFEKLFRITSRSHYIILLLFMSIISIVSAKGNCFNTKMGLSIEGGNYRRIRNLEIKECRDECLMDYSCLGYEWNSEEKVCYLKSRSTSGELVNKENSVIGFCEDYEDESRYRLQDHVIVGPIKSEMENVPNNDECKLFCAKLNDKNLITYYSWTPNPISVLAKEPEGNEVGEEEDEEEAVVLGRCTCMDMMHEVRLDYDSFSGFVPMPRRKHRRSALFGRP